MKEDACLDARRTKIIATLGPATQSEGTLRRLVCAGVDLFRLNFSHGDRTEHRTMVEQVERVRRQTGRIIGLIGDLGGPKIRVARLPGGRMKLEKDAVVTVLGGVDASHRKATIPSSFQGFDQVLAVGDRVLLDDGNLELDVTKVGPGDRVTCTVLRGGDLLDHKGINIPGKILSIPALTDKDREDLDFCLTSGFDYVALSFVQRASDLDDLREAIASSTHEAKGIGVIAKIEKPAALDVLDAILDRSDAIMVARGDLGVEIPPEKVPILQSQMVRQAKRCNKPAIVATQMLESMIEHGRPTRAEVSDVATAVLDEASALMLSGETAVGHYPIEAVSMMDRVIREVEAYLWREGRMGRLSSDISIYPLPNALARACTLLSQDIEIGALNVLTRSGRTARILSAARPNAPILAYCCDPCVVRRMQLLWGVIPIGIDRDMTMESFAETASRTVLQRGLAEPGEPILLVSSPLKEGHARALNSIIVCEAGMVEKGYPEGLE